MAFKSQQGKRRFYEFPLLRFCICWGTLKNMDTRAISFPKKQNSILPGFPNHHNDGGGLSPREM